ncbi:MAG: molybdenum ABC transporter ATP-binding protein ModC [Marinobacterium sp.]|nr:molybdenum ABC transporter ATP-binding protein ModC [Marinobacterium sp.]
MKQHSSTAEATNQPVSSFLCLKLQQQLGVLRLQAELELPLKGVTAIFGRSGAGKSSLINLVAGLSRPDCGLISLGERILFDSERGINLKPEQRRVGYVFQDARLFPHYRVKGNLLYGCGGRLSESFMQVVKLLGLESLLGRFPATLSGGERQRVAIGRALLSQPDILLMDEPLASLDLPRKQELLPWLEQLVAQIEIPVLYVSHSLDEIVQLADHLVVLADGQVQAAGALADVWHSEAMRPWVPVQQHSVLLRATLSHQHADYPLSCLKLAGQSLWIQAIDRPAGTVVRLRVHASDISISCEKPEKTSIRNLLKVRIEHLQPLPDQQRVVVHTRLDGQLLLAHITRWAADELALLPGAEVWLQLKCLSLAGQDWVVPHPSANAQCG